MVAAGAKIGELWSAGTERSASAAPRSYLLYGMHVQSDLPLPLDPVRACEAPVAWSFHRRSDPAPALVGRLAAEIRCFEPCHQGEVAFRLHRGEKEAWLSSGSVAKCRVRIEARQVDVYPNEEVGDDLMGLLLVGPVATFVLQELGIPSLHASAVKIGDEAAAFIGPKGRGKSTLAACFMRRGATLLTDDNLPLQGRAKGIFGLPGISMMKLWPNTVTDALGMDDVLPNLLTNLDKRLFVLRDRYAFANAPVKVRAIYLLNRETGDSPRAPSFSPLGPRESVIALLQNTAYATLLSSDGAARTLLLYADLVRNTAVRVLSYPDGFEHQDALYQSIQADYAAIP